MRKSDKSTAEEAAGAGAGVESEIGSFSVMIWGRKGAQYGCLRKIVANFVTTVMPGSLPG